MYVIALISWSDLWWWISVILKVSIGLGAVIFVHELGHYLVARLCGVKIEKFMIGFDIGGYKLSWRRGETIYGVGILPLGGYVKMLGQDDDPAHIAEQMKKSELDPNSTNAKAITGPNGETYYVDRRSYLAKSVPQRMAIISAGVVMNVIFAFIFAVIAYGMGVPYMPSVVSETVPGSPAWQAGLEPGDEIVRIGNRREPSFMQLKGGVTLGDLEHGIDCEIRRAADDKDVNIMLMPQQSAGHLATIGLIPGFSLILGDPPAINASPAWQALPKELKPNDQSEKSGKTEPGYVVVRVGDVEISNYRGFSEQLARGFDKPLVIAVRQSEEDERPDRNQPNSGEANASSTRELAFKVLPQQLRRFPLAMKMGPITSIRKQSPAEAAGFVRDDVIEQVDGKSLGQGGNPQESWDCETLPDYLRRAAVSGREVEFVVQRATKDGSVVRVNLRVKPQVPTSASILARPPGAPVTSN